MKKRLLLIVALVLVFVLALAACETTSYSVTFDFRNGTDPKTVKFSEYAEPKDFTNGDKEFAGWYTDEACTAGNEWKKPAELTADITVYAKWVDACPKVIFDAQNGTDPVSVKFDAGFAMPETPKNGDKVFGGWFTDAACTDGNEWTEPETLEDDITVYAKWITIYYVSFDFQLGQEPTRVAFDDNFAMPEIPENGDKVFLGWYTDKACTDGNQWTKPAELTANKDVFAKWSDKFYVTFHPQTEAEAERVLFSYDMKTPVYSNGMLTFGGWFTDEACTAGKEWTKPAELTADIDVYAKWYEAKVTFDPQNGAETFSIPFNSAFEMPSDPENGIQIFGGWYRDKACSPEKEWVLPGVLPCDITLYAKWIPVCFVTIDLQNGEQATKVKFDENFALPQNPENGDKTFLGWYTDKACTAGNEWTNPTELSADATVYAKWSGKFYVTFNPQTNEEAEKVLFSYNMEFPTFTNGKKTLAGWFTDAECTEGNEWIKPAELTADITVYAKWKNHVHDYGDSYLEFVECLHPDCHTVGRTPSTNEYKKLFVYNFNEEKRAEIDAMYDKLLEMLDKPLLPFYYDFEDLFAQYDSSLSYVIEQYQYAYVFYETYTDPHYKEDFDFVSNYRNKAITDYYSLFRKVYESDYRTFFFDGWAPEEVEQLLINSDSYGDSAYLEIQNNVDALLLEYDQLIADGADDYEISELYGELVVLNNQLAQQFGYANYMDYAYEIQYERYYNPASVGAMRSYVKQYMVPVFNKLMTYLSLFSFSSQTNMDFYLAMSGASVFKSLTSSKMAVSYMADYFKELRSDEFKYEIDYYKYADELFKRGNYYSGKDQGAFSYWIPAQQTSILFFGNVTNASGMYSYQNPFTFVHEFGHYYNGVYNKGLSLSMDHDETQSQGDEMLFLAWLSSHCAEDQQNGYKGLMYEQLANALYIICLATAVDEFEQAAYTGSYNGQPLPTRPNSDQVDYVELFSKVLEGYGPNVADQGSYWTYVVFDQAGYYISYAMSALPSVEIYVKAMEDFDAAKLSYMKLYAFSDDPTLVRVDESGNRELLANYSQILHYCGLQDPFEEGLYTTISNYFMAN